MMIQGGGGVITKYIEGGRYVHTVCGILDVYETHAVY